MDVAAYLRTLNWSSLQVLFGLGFERQNVDDTIDMAEKRCEHVLTLLHTRCLFSTNLSAHLLNNVDEWWGTDLITLVTAQGISRVKAINIEIDVTTYLDHMFVLVYLGKSTESPTGWYIIQSYVNQYETVVEPINALELIQVIQRWRSQGVNPVEWKHYFHADMPSTNLANPHVYTVNNIFVDNIRENVGNISRRVQDLLNDPRSYLHDAKYKCIISPYVSYQ